MFDLVVVESQTPGQIQIWAGNWLCTYILRNNRVVRVSEQSRYLQHPSARPDELIELADRLARNLFRTQKIRKETERAEIHRRRSSVR
jgi:hypothetical protein